MHEWVNVREHCTFSFEWPLVRKAWQEHSPFISQWINNQWTLPLPLCSPSLPSSVSAGLLSGLTPATPYVVTVTVCSPGGCTESRRHGDEERGDDDEGAAWRFTTPEEGEPCGVSRLQSVMCMFDRI